MRMRPVILLADNDPISLYVLQKYFAICQCQATWVHCTTAEQTLNYLQHHPSPALLLLEPVMPDMGPLTFLNRLQAEGVFNRMFTCIISALHGDEVAALTACYDVQGRYAKPVGKKHIMQIIKLSSICSPPITSY